MTAVKIIKLNEKNIVVHICFIESVRKIILQYNTTKFTKKIINSLLLTTGGKIKNTQNHRQIDARSEAEYETLQLFQHFVLSSGAKLNV